MLDEEDEERDSCLRRLLNLVARGTAIITEIYRLVELIPEPFKQSKYYLNKEAQLTLDDIVSDFSYFKNAEQFEARIESNYALKMADEQFCDTYIDILTRFYMTFEAVHRHAEELNKYIANLEDDLFTGQSLDTLLVSHEKRQLLCELYFQLGYMLLLVDFCFDGGLRERLIVSYYRYLPYRSRPETHLDDTCNLMRNTGFKCPHQKTYRSGADSSTTVSQTVSRPTGYPEDFFARSGANQSVVNTLIGKLQTVDIYNQTAFIFPHPEHRSNALAQQAAILYVMLFFCPNILKSERSRMREITDKFFSDNWVVHIFMGNLINLFDSWEPYRAARESMAQIYDVECVKSLSTQFRVKFNRNLKQLDDFLKKGWLNEETFIENSGRILNCIRESNVVMKWLILHSRVKLSWQANKLSKSLTSVVIEHQPDPRKLCEFLQDLCVLEKRVCSLYEVVSSSKQSRIEEYKSRACDMLNELISIFDDTKPQRWVKAGTNLSLAKILGEVRNNLLSINISDYFNNCIENRHDSRPQDVVVRLVNRLELARESYSDGKSLQVVQLFMGTKESLVKMLRYFDLSNDLRVVLQSIGDFSYSWSLMEEVFTKQIQEIIKENPLNMIGFEAIIIKLTSAYDSQLLRIQQMGSQTDLISVSQYYSSKLVSYIRNVLQVIPATIMDLIGTIISIQSQSKLAANLPPSKIPLDQLKDYASHEQRFQMLQLTCKISHYAKGIMAMPNTAVGLVRIDSRRMFEDGIRHELNRRMTDSIQEALKFDFTPANRPTSGWTTMGAKSSSSKSNQLGQAQKLLENLESLSSILNSYKRSLEYVQDFLFVYGLKLWREELGRIVWDAVNQTKTALISYNQTNLHNNPKLVPSVFEVSKSVKSVTFNVGANASKSLIASLSKPPATKVEADNDEQVLRASFMFKILNELIGLTNPRETFYDDQASAWFDLKHQQQILDATKVFKLIASSLSVAGLNGLDKLFSTLLMIELDKLNMLLCELERDEQDLLFSLCDVLNQVRGQRLLESFSSNCAQEMDDIKRLTLSAFFASLNGPKSQSTATIVGGKSDRLVECLLSVGQLQIMRLNVQFVLSSSASSEARHLHASLKSLNVALLATLRQGRRSPNQQKAAAAAKQPADGEALNREQSTISSEGDTPTDRREPPRHGRATAAADEGGQGGRDAALSLEDSQLVFDLANYLEWAGLAEPLSKLYTLALQHARGSALQTASGCLQRGAGGRQAGGDAAARRLLLEQCSRVLQGRGGRARARHLLFQPGNASAIDGHALYLGVATLLNHF